MLAFNTVTVLNIFETSVIYVAKMVQGNQLDNRCNWSDTLLSTHTQHAVCVCLFLRTGQTK